MEPLLSSAFSAVTSYSGPPWPGCRTFPKEFEPLAADRRGDVLALQGKPVEAKAEYVKAYKGFDERSGYRRLVEVKLNALGGDPVTTSTVTATAAAETAGQQK